MDGHLSCPGPLRGRDIRRSECDYYPEGGSACAERDRRSVPPVLSCTAWGLSCAGDYSRSRWALTPPFHPYLSAFRARERSGRKAVYFLRHCPSPVGFPAGAPAFTGLAALWCPDFPLRSPKTPKRPSAIWWERYSRRGGDSRGEFCFDFPFQVPARASWDGSPRGGANWFRRAAETHTRAACGPRSSYFGPS